MTKRQVARELGLAPGILYRWIEEYGPNAAVSESMSEDPAVEVVRLRKELARVQMEHDILKKAIGIFSPRSG
jgi:transposase